MATTQKNCRPVLPTPTNMPTNRVENYLSSVRSKNVATVNTALETIQDLCRRVPTDSNLVAFFDLTMEILIGLSTRHSQPSRIDWMIMSSFLQTYTESMARVMRIHHLQCRDLLIPIARAMAYRERTETTMSENEWQSLLRLFDQIVMILFTAVSMDDISYAIEHGLFQSLARSWTRGRDEAYCYLNSFGLLTTHFTSLAGLSKVSFDQLSRILGRDGSRDSDGTDIRDLAQLCVRPFSIQAFNIFPDLTSRVSPIFFLAENAGKELYEYCAIYGLATSLTQAIVSINNSEIQRSAYLLPFGKSLLLLAFVVESGPRYVLQALREGVLGIISRTAALVASSPEHMVADWKRAVAIILQATADACMDLAVVNTLTKELNTVISVYGSKPLHKVMHGAWDEMRNRWEAGRRLRDKFAVTDRGNSCGNATVRVIPSLLKTHTIHSLHSVPSADGTQRQRDAADVGYPVTAPELAKKSIGRGIVSFVTP